MKTKKCSKCGQEKPVSEFKGHAKSKDGLQSVCQKCRESERESSSKKMGGGKSKSDLDRKPILDADNLLSQFTPRELMKELYRRGYDGELIYVKKAKLADM